MIFEENIYPEEIQKTLDAIEMIQKGFDEGEVNSLTYQKSLDLLEKARRDITKLRTIKKIVQRDGKTFLATYHVKYGGKGVEEDTKKTVEVHPDTPETHIGESVKIKSTDGKVIRGVVHKIDAKGRSGITQLFLEIGPGVFKSITVTKIAALLSMGKEESPFVEKEPEKPVIKDIDGFFSSLEKIEDLGGSGSTELYENSKGDKYVIKKERPGVSGQLQDEVITDKIYKKLGFEAPTSYIKKGADGKDMKIALYTEDVKELGSLGPEAKKRAFKELQKGFALDCLLANWDVIGSSMDNVLCSSDGSYVRRSDNGGSLRYRAKGSSKSGAFGTEVNEIDIFRSDKNPSANKVYAGITDAEITKQIKDIRDNFGVIEKILGKGDLSAIGANDPELLKKLDTRLKYLENRFKAGVKLDKPEGPVLRKGMPSLTTQKYFDNGWDELLLDGVGPIKESIKNKIISIEKKHESKLKKWAIESGLPYDEYLDKLQATVDKVVKGSECFIAVHTGEERSKDILSKIFDGGGRFKTLFETGDSSGSTSTSCRGDAEYDYFGFDKDRHAEKEKRPVYGYFTPEDDGVINSEGVIPPPNLVEMYGDVSFKLKKSDALKKATITFKDSLGANYDTSATPFAKPHFTSLIGTFETNPITKLESKFDKKSNLGGYNYVECQYHGGLSIDNLESLHINPDTYGGSSTPRKKKFEAMNKIINKVNKFAASTGHKNLEVKIF